MTSEELFAKTLLTYEKGGDSHDSFYSHLPYVKDYDLCNWRPLRMYSGNIIKYYQYKMDQPVILVTDTEDDLEEGEAEVNLEEDLDTMDSEEDMVESDEPEEADETDEEGE